MSCLVSDLIKNVYATPVCFKLCTRVVRIYMRSSLRQYTQERCSPVKTQFDWGWGQMSGEAQREKRVGGLESSPCSLWQNEQEALSKVSVHSQKAAAELQATAWWLHRMVKKSRGGWGKVELGNLDFWIGEVGCGVGGPLLFFTPGWWAKSGPWWHRSSSGSRLRLCSHDNVRGSTLSPLLLAHSCQHRHSHGLSCCPWAQAVLPCRGAGRQRAVLDHWGRRTCRLWGVFHALFCSYTEKGNKNTNLAFNLE